MDINDKTVQALATSLNFRQLRQEILSSNIANAETPGYKAKSLDFEAALKNALNLDKLSSMQTNDDRHVDVGGGGLDTLEPEIYESPNDVVTETGNTVDVADEMAMMNENKIMFDATVQLLNKKLGLKKYAITSER